MSNPIPPLNVYALGSYLLEQLGKFVRRKLLGADTVVTLHIPEPVMIDITPRAKEAIETLAHAWADGQTHTPASPEGRQLMQLGQRAARVSPRNIRRWAESDLPDELLGRLVVFSGPPELVEQVNRTLELIVAFLESDESDPSDVMRYVEQGMIVTQAESPDEIQARFDALQRLQRAPSSSE